MEEHLTVHLLAEKKLTLYAQTAAFIVAIKSEVLSI